MGFPTQEQIERIRKEYPVGARVELLRMDDPQAPPIGSQGTVLGVDDIGSIMVRWDNGSGLNVVYGKDLCRVLLPDEVPGSVLTLVLEDGEWKQVGPVPKIDTSLIPKYVTESLARATLDMVREHMKDPDYQRKFEEWKRRRNSASAENDIKP